jgi:hypothetical protein
MEQLLDDAGTWACSNMKGIQISRISDEAIEAITYTLCPAHLSDVYFGLVPADGRIYRSR